MSERGRTQFCTGCVAGLPRTDDGYHVEQLDPTVRAYQDGLNVIVANAIFRAAAHARPLR